MRRLLLFGVALLPVLLFGFATDVAAEQGNHEGSHRTAHFETTLRGANEVPAVKSDITGDATITINLRTNRLCWNLDYDTSQTVTRAHIHNAAAGINGSIVFPFFNAPQPVKNRGCAQGAPSLLADIVKHPANYYVNVHTVTNPGGAGRGQLSAESDD